MKHDKSFNLCRWFRGITLVCPVHLSSLKSGIKIYILCLPNNRCGQKEHLNYCDKGKPVNLGTDCSDKTFSSSMTECRDRSAWMNFQNLFAHSFCKEPLEDSRGACVHNPLPYLSWIHICTWTSRRSPLASHGHSLSRLCSLRTFFKCLCLVAGSSPGTRLEQAALSAVFSCMSEQACFIVSLWGGEGGMGVTFRECVLLPLAVC